MQILLVLIFVCCGTTAAQQLCFIRVDSNVRRDAVGVVPSSSQKACNFRCIDTPGCDACMYYAEKGTCVMLGVPQSPPPGACPVPYTCYEKRYSGCPLRAAPPAIDYGYTPGPCSRPSDITMTPLRGASAFCGGIAALTGSQRRVILDTIAHDGTHHIRENFQNINKLDWDPYLGSWYHLLDNVKFYFASATCVLPPVPALSPACLCAPLPTESPMPTYSVYAPQPEPLSIDVAPACPSANIQVHYKRFLYNNAGVLDSRRVKSPYMQSIYCAMGEWMFLLDNGGSGFSQYSTVAATCIT